MKRVNIETEQLVFDGFFKIREASLKYERFDGSMSQSVRRLNLDRGDSVAALILNLETRKVILTNQFKYPTYSNGDGWIIEVVAGMVAKDEDHETAIKREVLEETGYRVSTLTRICSFYVSPGGSSERIILFYAEVRNGDHISPGGGLISENEDIELVEIDLAEIDEWLKANRINDAKTIISLMWLASRREKNSGQ